jgi:hypothetical protein
LLSEEYKEINDMKEETPKCKDCGQPMFEVAELAGTIQIGEYREEDVPIVGMQKRWYQTGARSPKLYQCPEDKTVAVY